MLSGTFCIAAGYIDSGALECRHDLSTARKFKRIKVSGNGRWCCLGSHTLDLRYIGAKYQPTLLWCVDYHHCDGQLLLTVLTTSSHRKLKLGFDGIHARTNEGTSVWC